MKLNENIIVKGKKTVLIPYENHHVAKYHEWMKSEEIQFLTGSEPLTLSEEYEMQKSWRQDEDKLTFIVLDAEAFERTQNEIDSMVGDTNIFLLRDDDDMSAEIEIMIAEKASRGKGLGKEALLLMMAYGVDELGIQRYIAKIKMKNTPSQRLFDKLGFIEVGKTPIFEEITYQNIIKPSEMKHLLINEGITIMKECKNA